MFTKTFASKERFRKHIVFGILLLFVGAGVLQQVQSTVKAGIVDDLLGPDSDAVYLGLPPLTLLLYPSEGDIVKDIIPIQWAAWASEDGANLSIYLYLCNENGNNCSPFLDNPYKNTGELPWNTTQYPDGGYTLLIEGHKSDGNIGFDSCYFQIKNHDEQLVNNDPIKPIQPFGQTKGMTGQEYYFTTSTIDPDGDLVYYLWDWGDGSTSGWLGPYYPGLDCEAKHTWTQKANYNITVKARDSYGGESNLSDPFLIRLPYSYNPILRFLELLFQQFPNAFPGLRRLLGY
jgi:PKD domain